MSFEPDPVPSRSVVARAAATGRWLPALLAIALAGAGMRGLQAAGSFRTELTLSVDHSQLRSGRTPKVSDSTLKECLEKRVRSMSGSDGKVEVHGADDVRISMPLERPSEALLRLLGHPARLELRSLEDVYTSANPGGRYTVDTFTVRDSQRDESTLRFRDRKTQRPISAAEFLSHCPLLFTNDDLVEGSAQVVRTSYAMAVRVTFDEKASRRLEKFVNHSGRLIGIVLDDELVGVNASIQKVRIGKPPREKKSKKEPKEEGDKPAGKKEQDAETLDIFGGFHTPEEAELLSHVLNSGPLPIPLRVTSHKTVASTD